MKIAVIPARAGSRRIPRKNLLPMPDGKQTVLANAIKQARAASCELVYVSTDDKEIAKEAGRYEAVVVERFAGLEQDHVGTQEVVASVCEYHCKPIDTVVCIYPCTPLLQASMIRQALSILSNHEDKFIMSVGVHQNPIQQAFEVYANELNNMQLRRCMPQFNDWASDKFPKRYYDAGQFYIGKAKLFIERVDLNRNATPYFLPSTRAIDINTWEDWLVASTLYKGLQHDD